MTIKIAFDSFEELMKYADRLRKGTLLGQAEVNAESKPSLALQPENMETPPQAENTRLPYGRQIAPHFPNANISQQTGAAALNVRQEVSAEPVPAQSAVPQRTMPPAAPAAVPTTPHEYTQDDLARAAMQLMDKGEMQQLQQLLAGYGCDTLQQLPKEQYGSFATALRGMGAQI